MSTGSVSSIRESVLAPSEQASLHEGYKSSQRKIALNLAAIIAISAFGLWWGFWPQLHVLRTIWLDDGLRSIGMLIPVMSVLLAIRAWRGMVWKRDTTWWGLVLCVVSLLAARLGSLFDPWLNIKSGVVIHMIPGGLLFFGFVSGVVLLFGGVSAYRRAFFPIALLLLVNPVPKSFTSLVDLPLQYIGAHTANAFAGWLKTPLDGSELRLMFSPALGMFIAPGCNGLRGAIAMGYLALIVGYLYGLRIWLHAVYVVAAVLLAYLLNLVRLCSLVLCYKVALGFPFLARHMEAADYLLGSLIFFSAAVFVFALPRRWTNNRPLSLRSLHLQQ